MSDERFFKDAEQILYNEFQYVLHMASKADLMAYILVGWKHKIHKSGREFSLPLFDNKSITEILAGGIDGATATAFAGALFCVRTTNALFAFSFSTDQIPYNSACDGNQYKDNNQIFHNQHPNLGFTLRPSAHILRVSFYLC